MDFAKFIVMAVFLNFILIGTINVVTDQYEDNLDNLDKTPFYDFTEQDNPSIEEEEGSFVSDLYEMTIGSAINWGRNVLKLISFASFKKNTAIETSFDNADIISLYVLRGILAFQIMFNFYVIIKVYGFIKNKSG